METNSTPNQSKTTESCKDCEEKDERIKKISDGIKEKIQAITVLATDSPDGRLVSLLIENVLSVLEKFNTLVPKKEEEQHQDTNNEEQEQQASEPAQNVNIIVQEPQITMKIESSPSIRSSSSSSTLPLRLQLSTSTIERTRKRKLSGSSSSSGSSTCTLPVKKQPIRIQTPDISSSCSRPKPTPSTSFNSSAIPGPSRRIKLEVNENIRRPSSSSLVQIPIVSTRDPIETALQIPLVLKKIFNCLNYDDLQSCSTAYEDGKWKEQVDSVILKRTVFAISISKNKPKISMIKSNYDKHYRSEYRNMNHLTTTLEAEEPGNEMYITVFHVDLASDPLSSFFKKFSPYITRLTLCYGALNKMSPQDFYKLLLSLPNVTQLSLATIPSEWKLIKGANKSIIPLNSPSSSSSTFTNKHKDGHNKDKSLQLLPRMKSIFFKASAEFYYEFIESLLQVTPNVKYVHNFPLHCHKAFKNLSSNNFNTESSFQLDKIRSVHFSSSDRTPSAGAAMKTQLKSLANFSSQMTLLSAHLSFKMASKGQSFEMWKQCCESLANVLQDNKNSINNLKIEPFPLQEYLEYPEMSALQKLHLFSSMPWKKCEDVGKICKFFSEDFNVLEAFPNLTKVKFEGTNCALGEFLEFFPSDIFQGNRNSGFQHVTSLNLKFEHLEDVESLQKTASLFPQVTTFRMDGDVRWLETRLLHILHLWPKIQKLKLTVDVVMTSSRLPSIQMYPLDSVFTGIPEIKCAELRETEEKRDIIIHEWQEEFAIANMTELTELKLIFAGNFAKTQKVIPLFSHVTPFYGFQLLPNLKVTFAVPIDNTDNEKIRQMLEPIQNYVDFQPNYY